MKKTSFYKRLGLVIAAAAVIGLAGCNSGGGGTDETSSQDPASSSTVESSSTETMDAVTAYEKIEVGDPLDGAKGGTELKEVTEMLGEPDDSVKGGVSDSSSESSSEAMTTDIATWNNVDGAKSFIVSFVNDKAASKGMEGLEVADHDKITLDQYNAVTTDGDYTLDQVLEVFGDPDGKSANLIDGKISELYNWTTNVDGGDGASINIEFVDGKVTNKANTGME